MKKHLLILSLVATSFNFFSAQDKKIAEECFKKADYQCAEGQYSKLVLSEHIQKYQSDYYISLGTAQRRLGKTTLAFKSYESALKSNPKSIAVISRV